MKFASIYTVAIAALTSMMVAALPSHAQAQSPSQRALFDEVDTNHDGYIDVKENNAANEKRFRTFDKNRDGNFSRAEMVAANKKMGQSDQVSNQTAQFYLSGMDTNGDDAASWKEFSAWMNQYMFVPLDTNHDGKLSWAEFILPSSPKAQ
jgi:Ca2+-binding EF-hand superfamily protein